MANETIPPAIALFYCRDAYTEALVRHRVGQVSRGLMGRQVAGKGFFDALLRHSTQREWVGIVPSRADALELRQRVQESPNSQNWNLRVVGQHRFQSSFFPTSAATILHLPGPPPSHYAWARRRHGPHAFALSGVTHTLCSQAVMQALGEFVTAPFELYDALVCTSRAAAQVVRTVTSLYIEYLRERTGTKLEFRLRLPVIPLGVDTTKYRPPTAEEYATRRKMLGIGEDEIAVLFVGRLSFHSKAHPVPMYQGLSEAAKRTGRKVHFLLAGAASHADIERAFHNGAKIFAPNIRVSFLKNAAPPARYLDWHAADIFTSLADNLQETFGLSVIEAMACGLPVVVSDWNGYRDLVVDGQTGILVPTYMLDGATATSTERYLRGETNYDHFVAECSQATAVDVAAAIDAYTRLIRDAELRKQMGAAGRQRALEMFDWTHVIRSYETLWQEQEAERRARWQKDASTPAGVLPQSHLRSCAFFPMPEISFSNYPTQMLTDNNRVRSVAEAELNVDTLLQMRLTNHSAERRISDPQIIGDALRAAATGCTIRDLEAFFRRHHTESDVARPTIAWMIKYGLLQLAAE